MESRTKDRNLTKKAANDQSMRRLVLNILKQQEILNKVIYMQITSKDKMLHCYGNAPLSEEKLTHPPSQKEVCNEP
ncbi:MAG: hypothetical protein AUK55_04585 [Syntrophobacteraceae bacterium CG2_30_61_12]|nr:MAG: hypothetical protein AUK55_04585 [Syntrophobacteraceae bacterium CG2_30_61_12]PIU32189.1 MAG: hypothetical protein COT06_04020 [Syntrophobacteraceae bacterium CG07_land_8_20_14_0_80_61_8]